MAEDLSDEYVAGLLAKDAKESSIRYSAMGLEGFAPSKYDNILTLQSYALMRIDLQQTSQSRTHDF